MNHEHWKKFYKFRVAGVPSNFAKWVNNYMKGDIVDLGCGSGRDLRYFYNMGLHIKGVDQVDLPNPNYVKSDVGEYIRNNESPDTVYTRFFWHAIERELQLEILKWTKDMLLIEARTTEDRNRMKIHDNHDRNFVDVGQLVVDLKANGFQIIRLEEGLGFSRYRKENPHLVRVIAQKTCVE